MTRHTEPRPFQAAITPDHPGPREALECVLERLAEAPCEDIRRELEVLRWVADAEVLDDRPPVSVGIDHGLDPPATRYWLRCASCGRSQEAIFDVDGVAISDMKVAPHGVLCSTCYAAYLDGRPQGRGL